MYRVDHVPTENRLCPLCESKQVENETRFLFQCQKYSAQRQAFSNKVQGIEPNFEKKKIQPPGQVQHFGPGAGKLFVAVLSHVRGVGQIKNIFSLVLRGTCYFSRGLHNGCGLQDYVFLRKNTGYLSESCWRGITYQN